MSDPNENDPDFERRAAARQTYLRQRLAVRSSAQQLARTIPARPEPEQAPLSYAQNRLWFFYQWDPQNSIYNRPTVLRLRGDWTIEKLQSALHAISQRHAALRTAFRMRADGEVVQTIHANFAPVITQVDLAELPPAEQADQLEQLLRQTLQQPFDLTAAPALRAQLFRLGDRDFIFLLVTHHMIFDSWSEACFIQELQLLCAVAQPGTGAPLPAPVVDYADFAAWQCNPDWIERRSAQLAYWKTLLAGQLPVLELPGDRPRPALQTFGGRSQPFELDAAFTRQLKALAAQHDVSLFMLLLAVFNLLLYRYSGQSDLLVGSPIAGRIWPELQHSIGVFINMLVLRTSLSGAQSFRDYLQHVRTVCLAAYQNQEIPFDLLVEVLQPARTLNQTPIYQVMFNLENIPEADQAAFELRLEHYPFDPQVALYDLSVELSQRADRLQGSFIYNQDLFDAHRIERMAGHYRFLLEQVLVDPERALAAFQILTAGERKQILLDWNDTRVDFPVELLHAGFERVAAQYPHQIAVQHGAQSLSYGELDRRANQLAHSLLERGLPGGACVAIWMERSLEMAIAFLGVLKAGCFYLPLDPIYPRQRLRFMLQDAGAKAILTQARFQDALVELHLPVLCLDSAWDEIGKAGTANPCAPGSLEDPAYLIYTSGSTGSPKGVLISHRSINNQLKWLAHVFRFGPDDVMLYKSSISFDASIWELYAVLLAGGKLVMADPSGQVDARYLIDTIAQFGVTLLQLVPTQLQILLAAQSFNAQQCPTLRLVFCGGEALQPQFVEQFYARFPQATLINLYGPTEATINATSWVCSKDASQSSVPIGKPIANLQALVLDAHGQLAPVGIPGELYLGGVGLALGYLHQPQATAEKFIADPFGVDRHGRLYRTGDSVRWLADGSLEYLGRLDHQVKLRGFRIELTEIEAHLRQFPGVDQVVVVLREDIPGDQRLAAYCVMPAAADLDTLALRAFLKKRLPDYMIPAHYMRLDAIPLLPNGKLDRKLLPTPTEQRPQAERATIAPANAIEEKIAGIWADMLQVDTLSVEADFFELGGHSLLATRLVARLEQALGVQVSLLEFFNAPTVRGLAAFVTGPGWRAATREISPLRRR